MDMQWSSVSYRLDKVKEIFGLPCVVRLEEGYMPPEETEEFAQGDIITLDAEVPSDKVGAYFIKWDVQEPVKKSTHAPDYGVITPDNQEVFLPYTYDGKLRVLKKNTKVNGVKELAGIFPGYAELEGKLTMKTNQGESVTLSKGTIIELDRVIPGSTYGSEIDKLVIQFEHSKETKLAGLPFNMKGKFRTKADNRKYTIKEAIEKYGLPLDVKFVNDEIRQKFYQDVLTGRRKLGSVTDTLKLTRIVEKCVLIGHYKPVPEPDNSGNAEEIDADKKENSNAENDDRKGSDDKANNENVRRRTVVIIPVDNPEIGEIPVSICEGDVLTIYESLVNIKNVSEAQDMVKETLCLDFEVTPGMKLISAVDNSRKYENVKHEQRKRTSNGRPPPLPARPANPSSLSTAFEGVDVPPRTEQFTPDNDYLVPLSKRSENPSGDYVIMKRNYSDKAPPVLPRRPKQFPAVTSDSGQKAEEKDKKHFWSNWKKSSKAQKKENLETHSKGCGDKAQTSNAKPTPQIEDDGLGEYEEIEKMKKTVETNLLVGTPVCPSDDLGEYEEINGVKHFISLAEMSADTSSRKKYLSGYDEIEDVEALHLQGQNGQKHLIGESVSYDSESQHTSPTKVSTQSASGMSETLPEPVWTQSGNGNLENRQTSCVSESSSASAETEQRTVANLSGAPRKTNNKLFQDLTNDELVQRLELCSLPDMADTCKSENLDGAFFADVSHEFLKGTMGLQGIKLAKFLKMRDENWVPK